MQTTTPQAAVEEDLDEELHDELELAFTPIHKRCLGVAVGAVLGTAVFAVTMIHMVRSPDEVYPLVLLQQFFIGYSVSFSGALVGLVWGMWVGFVLGWTFAFLRNLTLTVSAFVFRAKAELAQGGGFLDHI
jgi:hypothetical protein